MYNKLLIATLLALTIAACTLAHLSDKRAKLVHKANLILSAELAGRDAKVELKLSKKTGTVLARINKKHVHVFPFFCPSVANDVTFRGGHQQTRNVNEYLCSDDLTLLGNFA